MMTMKGDEVEIQPVASHKYLFTTSTCPNCRMAKKMLEGEELEIIDAEQNPELVKQYGIRQAPTLVITDGAQVKKYVNASNIQKYVDEELFRATAIIEMDGWTHVCWMCVRLFYMLFLFLGKVVDILGCDGILIFEI